MYIYISPLTRILLQVREYLKMKSQNENSSSNKSLLSGKSSGRLL